MIEWKMRDMENVRKYIYQKMAENAHPENGRKEMHETENIRKFTYLKMAENMHPENDRTEMNNMENGRKYTYWKMLEKSHLETYRTVDAQNSKWQKINIPENGRKCTPGK